MQACITNKDEHDPIIERYYDDEEEERREWVMRIHRCAKCGYICKQDTILKTEDDPEEIHGDLE